MRAAVKCLLLVCVCVVIGTYGTPARAWEFTMAGLLEWKWEYVTQRGSLGFFGPYDVSNTGGGFQARSNGWLGIEDYDGLFYGKHPGVVSGSDASRQSTKMEIYPTLRINRAIAVYGKYRISGHYGGNSDLSGDRWDNIGPFTKDYTNSLVPGQDNAHALGTWSMLWAVAQTPWGSLSYGKRPFAVGCGLLYNNVDATQESLMVSAPWGPLSIAVGVYPMTVGHGDFYDLPRRLYLEAFQFGLPYYYFPNQLWDKNGQPTKLMAMVNYAGGNLSVGAGAQYQSLHFGPEGIEIVDILGPSLDQTDLEAWFFFRYNNGRFFCNAEVDTINRVRRYEPTEDGMLPTVQGPPVISPREDGGGSYFAPEYVESWRWMVETGFFAGPAKSSFLIAYLPGPDRRHGVLIDRQPTTYVGAPPEKAVDAVWLNRHVGNSGVFRPYSLLLSHGYGAGVNCYDLNGNGCMTDALVLAARVDYAVAANLNVFASLLHAERDSHAWQWGSIRPGSRREDTFDEGTAFRQVIFRPRGLGRFEFVRPVPTIPDNDLGWELGLGAQWELLQGWQLSITGAYWQPGKWFKYACIDRSVEDWSDGGADVSWGINPNRTIDPIVGMEFTVKAAF